MRGAWRRLFLIAGLLGPGAVWAGGVRLIGPPEATGLAAYTCREARRLFREHLGVELLGVEGAKLPRDLAGGLVVLGTAANNPVVRQLLEQGSLEAEPHPQGYAMRAASLPGRPGAWLLAIAGADDRGTLYALRDLEHYELRRFRRHGEALRVQPFLRRDYPRIEHRGHWVWGCNMPDKKAWMENMSRWKLNELIHWDNAPPAKAREYVQFARERGIRLIWGFGLGWEPEWNYELPPDFDRGEGRAQMCPSSETNRRFFRRAVLEKVRTLYAPTGCDGIYFQTFTEQPKCTCPRCREKPMGQLLVEFVNPIVAAVKEEFPRLWISCGIHGNHVRPEDVRGLDPRCHIYWENREPEPPVRPDAPGFGAISKALYYSGGYSKSCPADPPYTEASLQRWMDGNAHLYRVQGGLDAHVAHVERMQAWARKFLASPSSPKHASVVADHSVFCRRTPFVHLALAEAQWNPNRAARPTAEALLAWLGLRDEVARHDEAVTARHDAVGAPVTLHTEASTRHPGGGPAGLTDGCHAVALSPRDTAWQGYQGNDLDAVLDLGAPTPLVGLAASFLHAPEHGILLPSRVDYAVSADGKEFRTVATVRPLPASEQLREPFRHLFPADGLGCTARYVRVRAANAGTLPAPRPRERHPAWLFADEVLVNPPAAWAEHLELAFACPPHNDLYRVLAGQGITLPRFDTPSQAVAEAPPGGAVLILAEGYPRRPTEVPAAVVKAARAKNLRLYVEYPESLPDVKFAAPRPTQWERAVVASDFFGPALPTDRILAVHDCRFVPTEARSAHLVAARVAGYDTAVYGLPEESWPLLFEHPSERILVATTKLSQFVTARYGPSDAWAAVWRAILGWLQGGPAPTPRWTPTVRPSYGPEERLPHDAGERAFRRGVAWLRASRLLVPEPWEPKPDAPLPFPPARAIRGDGTHGCYEGYSSRIRHDGTQPVRRGLRNDCIGETAMAFAFGGTLNHETRDLATAAKLLDYITVRSPFAQGPRADPESPSYGLLSWAKGGHAEGTYYGDDNARSLLGQMAAAALLGSDRWDKPLLRCILANFRTAGRLGFRGNALREADLQARGWRHYHQAATVNFAPHYEAYLWACYLWAYRHTGHKPLLERAKTALRMTLNAYPDQWRWTNGIQQERARLLLPLAWLVRVENTAEHRAWLLRIADDLIADQAPCGAIREELGPPGHGTIPPPRSNAAYGEHEAPIIQENGDPACDLLYTGAFALLGLHEAAAAHRHGKLVDAERKLADFLCRIQVRSEAYPELHGAWFRAFDFRRWDYWGSNADSGWGAWCIETGWKQAWILAVLALRDLRTSLWDLTADSRVADHFPELRQAMLPPPEPPERPEARQDAAAPHLARGKPVALAAPYHRRYPGRGDGALTDGQRATRSHRHMAWQGYWQADLDATVDLGKAVPITAIGAGFLQATAVGIYLPSRVEFAISEDGESYRTVATVPSPVPTDSAGPLTKEFWADARGVKARYVRVRARNVGTIPEGHPAQGRKAWLFVDEILVR